MSEASDNYITVKELQRLFGAGKAVTLIDARTAEEFAAGHVPGAVNITLEELPVFAERRGNADEGLLITMCGSSGRGQKAAAVLDSLGARNVLALEGGLKAWKEAGFAVA